MDSNRIHNSEPFAALYEKFAAALMLATLEALSEDQVYLEDRRRELQAASQKRDAEESGGEGKGKGG